MVELFTSTGEGFTFDSILSPRRANVGVANGKIRDSPRRRDPYLKIRDQDLEALTKSEPET